MRRVLRWGAVVVALAAVAAGLVWWRATRPSTPISQNQALSRFRSATEGSQAGPPLAGVYTYATSGRECAGAGPLHVCRDLPPQAQLVITRPGGDILAELELSQEHLEASRWQVRPGGRFLVWQRSRVTFAGIGQDDAQATRPATLALPAHPRVGQTWIQTFRFGGLPVTSRNDVLGTRAVEVGGRSFRALVIRSVSRTGGDHPGTEVDLAWHVPELGLDVRTTIDRRVGGTFPYSLRAEGTLLHPNPAR